MTAVTIALAQVNVTVGALEANRDHILLKADEAAAQGAAIVVFPELALSGYPPEDLLLKPHFLEDCEAQLEAMASQLPTEPVVLVGSPRLGPDRALNAAVAFQGGQLVGSYAKMLLPNYGVFDEKRVMSAGTQAMGLTYNQAHLALHVCEDSWYTDTAPCTLFEGVALDGIINLSSSPYHRNKDEAREEILARLATHLQTHILYCNLVGGQDELVFDGSSIVVAPDGSVAARARSFQEDLLLFDLPISKGWKKEDRNIQWLEVDLPPTKHSASTPITVREPMDDLPEVYEALKLGLHDYVVKNGFERVVVAISGGIDSALVAAVAVDALGSDRVVGLTMPSRYSSEETLSDAEALGERLGIPFHTLPIEKYVAAYEKELTPYWEGRPADSTEENLQARIRGNLVMAFSNKFGWLVLTTGNKSEMATGYCTLYGDMAGGFAVIKDVPKTLVFALCTWRNEQGAQPVIPPSTITRPPSAELRADQKDSDSLPPYEVLDPILEMYVEQDRSAAEIVEAGYDADTVLRILHLVNLAEYKRRQGAPGIKITPKAFGKDRRLPITNRYRERT